MEYEAKFNGAKNLEINMIDTLKFKFPFKNSQWLWFGVKRSGDLKIHYDSGNTVFFGKQFNLFGNVKTNVEGK